MQTERGERNVRCVYETNVTALPVYSTSPALLVFEFGNHILNEFGGLAELLGEGHVSAPRAKGLLAGGGRVTSCPCSPDLKVLWGVVFWC